MYCTSRARLAVSTATCKAVSFAVKESSTRGCRSTQTVRGSGENCEELVFRYVHRLLWLLFTSPQPQELEPTLGSSGTTPAGRLQWWPWVKSIKELPPSCSSATATDSRERQNPSTARRHSVWEHPSVCAVSARSPTLCKKQTRIGWCKNIQSR